VSRIGHELSELPAVRGDKVTGRGQIREPPGFKCSKCMDEIAGKQVQTFD